MSMGNPHAVVFVEDVDAVDLVAVGPHFENHPSFPSRINTEFVQVRPLASRCPAPTSSLDSLVSYRSDSPRQTLHRRGLSLSLMIPVARWTSSFMIRLQGWVGLTRKVETGSDC